MASKNTKTIYISKPEINLETKIFLGSNLFFRCFQVKKKTYNHNFPHHMEPFDTKIDYFDGRNLPQHQLSLSKPEFSGPPFSSPKKELKIKFDIKMYF
jgi:hypothetical protein